jgi:diguanylate cyclase (GGDEF)-like protein
MPAISSIRALLRKVWLMLLLLSADLPATPSSLEALEAGINRDPRNVVTITEQALRQAREDRDRKRQLHLQYILAKAWLTLGNYQKALSIIEPGVALARELQDDRQLARFLAGEAEALMDIARGEDQALVLINQAIGIARKLEDQQLLAEMLADRGQILMLLELDEMALQDFLKAMKLYQQLPATQRQKHITDINDLFNAMALSYMTTGNYLEAIRLLEKIAATDDPENHFLHTITSYNLGKAHLELKHYQQALEYFRRSEELSRAIGDKESLVGAISGQGMTELQLGNIPKATKLFEQALKLCRNVQSPAFPLSLHLDLAKAYLQLGNSKKAQEHLQAADIFIQSHHFRSSEETAVQLQAQLAASRNDYQQAYLLLEELLKARRNNLEKDRIKHTQILQARFSLILKEAENRLLQEQSRRQADHVKMLFTIFAIIVVIGGLIYLRERSLKRKMAAVALTDELTRTANRRQILQLTRQEMQKRQSQGQTLSIAMVDLDHFKKINDQFGHDTGDQVLKLFADTGAALIRHQDLMGRLGGEEWLFTFPDTSADNARSIMERLARKYREQGRQQFPDIPELHFSAGIAEMEPDDRELEQLIKRADQAMYTAKQQGRNRIILTESSNEH